MKNVQVAVIGAGPAGSAAAIHLKRGGAEVALIDKAHFPRNKVCGDGIPFKTFRLLQELGFSENELLREGYPITGMTLYAANGSPFHLHGSNAENKKSGCIPREIFDNLLFQKAKMCVDSVYEGFRLIGMEKQTGGYRLHLQKVGTDRMTEIKTQLVIGADGATGYTAKEAGLKPEDFQHSFEGMRLYYKGENFPNRIRIFYDSRILPGYLWIFPVSANRANVGIMAPRRSNRTQKIGLKRIFEDILKTNDTVKMALKNAEADSPLRGALLPLGSLPGSRVSDHLLLVGDAASSIHPITGGGIYFALYSARMAARIGLEALQQGNTGKEALVGYDQWYHQTLMPGFLYARKFRKWFASERTLNRFLSLASRFRPVATFLTLIYGQSLPEYALLRPGFWLKVLLG